jgi:hypothetical protein
LKIKDIIAKKDQDPKRFKIIIFLYFLICIIIILPILHADYNAGEFSAGICNFSIYIVFVVVLWVLTIECNKEGSISGFFLGINFMVLAFSGPLGFIIMYILNFNSCLVPYFIYFCVLSIISLFSVYFAVQDKIKINIFLGCMCVVASLGLTYYFFYNLFLN